MNANMPLCISLYCLARCTDMESSLSVGLLKRSPEALSECYSLEDLFVTN